MCVGFLQSNKKIALADTLTLDRLENIENISIPFDNPSHTTEMTPITILSLQILLHSEKKTLKLNSHLVAIYLCFSSGVCLYHHHRLRQTKKKKKLFETAFQISILFIYMLRNPNKNTTIYERMPLKSHVIKTTRTEKDCLC